MTSQWRTESYEHSNPLGNLQNWQILLVRHGFSWANGPKDTPSVVNFDPRNPYTLYPPQGWQGAAAAAEKCKEICEEFEEVHFHSSPITRCIQTTEVIASAFNLTFDARFSETRLGEWFVGRDYEGANWRDLPPNHERRGSENEDSVRARILRLFEDWARFYDFEHKKVAVIGTTHHEALVQTRALLLDEDQEETITRLQEREKFLHGSILAITPTKTELHSLISA